MLIRIVRICSNTDKKAFEIKYWNTFLNTWNKTAVSTKLAGWKNSKMLQQIEAFDTMTSIEQFTEREFMSQNFLEKFPKSSCLQNDALHLK